MINVTTRPPMTPMFLLRTTLLAAAMLLPMLPASAMTRAEYQAAIHKCDPLVGDPRALCTEAVKQQREIDRKAQQRASGTTPPSRRPAAYTEAMKECRKLVGDPQALCSEAAKQKWPLPARVDNRPKDAATVKRDADYAVAMRQCNLLAGSDQAVCTEEAKLKFGQR